MGECSICIHAHSDGGWVNAKYVYMHIQTVDERMLTMYTCTLRALMGECSICIPAHSDCGWVNAQYVYMHIQAVDV